MVSMKVIRGVCIHIWADACMNAHSMVMNKHRINYLVGHGMQVIHSLSKRDCMCAKVLCAYIHTIIYESPSSSTGKFFGHV